MSFHSCIVLPCDHQIVIFAMVGRIICRQILLGKLCRPFLKAGDPENSRFFYRVYQGFGQD